MMGELPKQRVLPKKPATVYLGKKEKEKIEGFSLRVGCVLYVVGLVILMTLANLLMSDLYQFGFAVAILLTLIVFIGPFIGLIILDRQLKAPKILRAEQEMNAQAVSAENQRAANLTNTLHNTLRQSSEIAERLPKLLANTSDLLAQARQEYADNAFDPYWDAIEQATISLGKYYDAVQKLSQHAQFYYASLESENHTFPQFPIKPDDLPNPIPSVEELRRTLRLGQTNHDFTDIWHYRQTRQVLIAGFDNLTDAVFGLHQTLQESMFDYKSVFSSDVAKLIEEQAKTRKTVAEEEEKTRKALSNQSANTERAVKEVADKVSPKHNE